MNVNVTVSVVSGEKVENVVWKKNVDFCRDL